MKNKLLFFITHLILKLICKGYRLGLYHAVLLATSILYGNDIGLTWFWDNIQAINIYDANSGGNQVATYTRDQMNFAETHLTFRIPDFPVSESVNYRRLEFVFKPGAVLNPGEGVRLSLFGTFIDPVGTVFDPTVPENNLFRNTAAFSATINGKDFSAESIEKFELKPIVEELRIYKTVLDNSTNHFLGDTLRIGFQISGTISSFRDLSDLVLIDFLPAGINVINPNTGELVPAGEEVTPTEGAENLESAKVFDNYLNSGKQALVIKLKPSFLQTKLKGKFSKLELPKFKVRINEHSLTGNNENKVFATSNNLGQLGNLAPVRLLGTTADIYDVNQNGNYEEKVLHAVVNYAAIMPVSSNAVKYIRYAQSDLSVTGFSMGFNDEYDYI